MSNSLKLFIILVVVQIQTTILSASKSCDDKNGVHERLRSWIYQVRRGEMDCRVLNAKNIGTRQKVVQFTRSVWRFLVNQVIHV